MTISEISQMGQAPAPQGAAEAIHVENLHKKFGELHVLKGVSLSARDGDVIAIIGGSGSGKSTLLRCINFLENPTSGLIRVNGEEIRLKTDNLGNSAPADRKQIERIRSRLGMVFQNFNLWSHMTLLENVIEVPVHVLGVKREEAVATAQALLERVGLAEKRDVYPAFLSGGQQQRGAIARALVQKAKIILADEPVASLDPVSARRVMEILRDLNQQDGLTVVVTLHQVDYALRYCDRVVALKAGKVVYDGPAAQLERKQLIDIYGPEFEDVFWEGAPQ